MFWQWAPVQTVPSLANAPPLPTATCHPLQEAAKQRALRVLKQKKLYACAAALACALCLLHSPLPPPVCAVLRYEGQRDQLYQQQFNVEQTNFALASVQDTKVQVRGQSNEQASQNSISEMPCNAHLPCRCKP